MSSLGAQARAAELAAAMIAKKRAQAHKEEEEQAAAANQHNQSQRHPDDQSLAIPPTNRMSLGAFLGQPRPTKNKGAKAFRPLHTDDIVEDTSETTGDDDKKECSSTFTFIPKDPERLTQSPTELINTNIPTAPRVMRLNSAQQNPSMRSISLKATPSSMSLALPPKPSTMVHSEVSPNFPLVPHFPPDGSKITTPNSRSLHGTPSPLDNSFHAHDQHSAKFNMAPIDLSPTKQEIKLAELRLRDTEANHTLSTEAEYYANQETESSQYLLASYAEPNPYDRDYAENFAGFFPNTAGFQNFGFDQQQAYFAFAMKHNQAYTGYDGAEQTGFTMPLRTTPLIPQWSAPSRSVHAYQEAEPYDTRKAMEKFLAEQVERSKNDQGKTVLRNPERQSDGKQKQKAYDQTSEMFEHITRDGVSLSSQSINVMQNASNVRSTGPFLTSNRDESVSKDPRVSPGRGQPRAFRSASTKEDSDKPVLANKAANKRLQSESLPPWFFELQPTTPYEERQLLKARMAKIAKDLTIEAQSNPLVTENKSQCLLSVNEWFSADNRGQTDLRRSTTNISVNHAIKNRQLASTRSDGALPPNFKPGIDDGFVSSLALGEVACNIQTYLEPGQDTAEQRAKFNRVKAVPEWCTEKKGLSEANEGHSYFGTTWGTPPSRVARDPRFRPEILGKNDRDTARKINGMGGDDITLLERLRLRKVTPLMRRTG
ncbi:MAG: hypothetical protein Q9227_001221 [Pyrenula ochraceoflavens]